MRVALMTSAAAFALLASAPAHRPAYAIRTVSAPDDASVAVAQQQIRGAMDTFDREVLSKARASGKKFPLYGRWLGQLSAGIKTASEPATVFRAAKNAEDELGEYIPVPPVSRDLVKSAAFKQRTHPVSLTNALLSVYRGVPPDRRRLAAEYLSSHYALP